ncbi:MAG TPA: T9SS type A sorting domain-containing protein, partial [Saprospiraceae bacterium]|nr:T9SS type A sorting domain-containing protein [Saprospiraceae bacterium]
ANLGNSATNPDICIGGMQDNATAIYTGDPAWTRVIGGDGECAAISPLDDQIMYGSSQYLNMLKSTDGGESWYNIGPNSEDACFNGPFEITPSDPNIMYAGAQSLHRSDDAGESWSNASGGFIAVGDPILTIAVHPTDPDVVFCSTAPVYTNTARVFKVNAGVVTELTGLPNRVCMDIAIHPTVPGTVYAVFAGFNTQHVWRSTNNGANWTAIDNGLPDVPVSTILIDPLRPDHLYIGNDLGVWLSQDAGASWEVWSADAPQAMLAMHLSISADRKLRVATHGLGVWQTDMAYVPVGAKEPVSAVALHTIQPNPVVDVATVKFSLSKEEKIALKVLDISGKIVWRAATERLSAGEHSRPVDLGGLPAGTYGVLLETGKGSVGRLVVKG